MMGLIGEQIKSARDLIRWKQKDLADAANISIETVKRVEAMKGEIKGVQYSTIQALESTLSAAGIVFTPADEINGPGVRLTLAKFTAIVRTTSDQTAVRK